MPGGIESQQEEQQLQQQEGDDCSFVWDETTNLYFHSRSGFYHDPSAGWYYSSREGVYYKFKNGSYVLWDSHQLSVNSSPGEIDDYSGGNIDSSSRVTDESVTDAFQSREDVPCCGSNAIVLSTGYAACSSSDQAAPEIPPPPSEWLEETLINLFLSGYNQKHDAVMEDGDKEVLADEDDTNDALEEGGWIKEEHISLTDLAHDTMDDDALRDEESWRAQYGQVIHADEETMRHSSVVDLWDWAMVMDTKKNGKGLMARLVGRLTKPAAKLHPSMPSSGALFKTAPISEVHLNLVRVRTGQVYKLHGPSAKYLASLSSYDSSNPTKDWGFPEFTLVASNAETTLMSYDEDGDYKNAPVFLTGLSSSGMQRNHIYRDRAAERRKLHGSFGMGPGQKSSLVDDMSGDESPISTEEAAAEALNMSFGSGSYAQKILKGMGWKEGDALGSSNKGLVEPLKVVGNIGNAGLGWSNGRPRHH